MGRTPIGRAAGAEKDRDEAAESRAHRRHRQPTRVSVPPSRITMLWPTPPQGSTVGVTGSSRPSQLKSKPPQALATLENSVTPGCTFSAESQQSPPTAAAPAGGWLPQVVTACAPYPSLSAST